MSTALDLAALAAQGELKIPIARGVVSEGGSGTDYTGWSGVSSVFVEAKVEVREQSRGFATLTLTVEGSANGSDWSTLETFTFGHGGTQSATVSSPDDHLRVSWAVGGGSEWQIIEVTAAPSIIDTGAGGGSLPGFGYDAGSDIVTVKDDADVTFAQFQRGNQVVEVENLGVDASASFNGDTAVYANNGPVFFEADPTANGGDGEVKIGGAAISPSDYQQIAEKGQANGYASLDGGGLVSAGQSPVLESVLGSGNDAGGTTITNLPEPANASEAATKQYVDAAGLPSDTAYNSPAPPTLSQGSVTAVSSGAETRWRRIGRTVHVRTWVQVENGTIGEDGEEWMLELPGALPTAENNLATNGPIAAGYGYVNAGPSVTQLPVTAIWRGVGATRSLSFIAPSGSLGLSTGTDLQMLDGSEVQIALVYEAAAAV